MRSVKERFNPKVIYSINCISKNNYKDMEHFIHEGLLRISEIIHKVVHLREEVRRVNIVSLLVVF